MKFTQTKPRALALVAVMVLSVLATSVVFSGAGLAAVDTADRSIDATTAEPGDTVDVELELTVSEDGERLTVQDDFTHVVDASAGNLQHNGESIEPVVFAVDHESLTVAAEDDFQAGDTVMVKYTVTVSETIDSETTVTFDGHAGIGDQDDVAIGGDTELDILPPGENPIETADRSLSPQTVDAGEEVDVQLSLELDDPADRITVFEDYDEMTEATATSVTHEGESAEPVIDAIDDVGLTAALDEEFSEGDTVTISYSVTVPDDADDGDELAFDGVATADDNPDVQITGDASLHVDVEEDTTPDPSPAPAPTPDPADFQVTAVDLDPSETGPGEEFTVTANVTNDGGDAAVQDVEFGLNGDLMESKEVELGEDEQTSLQFTSTAPDSQGTYDVTVTTDDHEASETLTVSEPAPDESATFVIGDLTVEPNPAEPGEDVTVTSTIENVGDETATQTVTLDIDGTTAAENLTLDGGESETVELTIPAPDEVGEFSVNLSTDDESATEMLTVETDDPADDEIDDETDDDLPGFGVVAALAALGVVLAARGRMRS